jgi:glucose-6-phosphate 1-dehydrogenase
MRAYERLLGDAIEGDPTLFVREDEVLAAWAIVEPALRAPSAVHEYEPGTWGPPRADALIAPDGGWNNPTVDAPVPVTLRSKEIEESGESKEGAGLEGER